MSEEKITDSARSRQVFLKFKFLTVQFYVLDHYCQLKRDAKTYPQKGRPFERSGPGSSWYPVLRILHPRQRDHSLSVYKILQSNHGLVFAALLREWNGVFGLNDFLNVNLEDALFVLSNIFTCTPVVLTVCLALCYRRFNVYFKLFRLKPRKMFL